MRDSLESGRIRAVAVAASAAALALAGCGEEDFDRAERRPPVPVQLSGVITPERLIVSPSRLGAGPVVLLISNQTGQSHTVLLEGEQIRERVGPINPRDTGQIQADLATGTYELSAGSERATARELTPATLRIGPKRPTGEDELELP